MRPLLRVRHSRRLRSEGVPYLLVPDEVVEAFGSEGLDIHILCLPRVMTDVNQVAGADDDFHGCSPRG